MSPSQGAAVAAPTGPAALDNTHGYGNKPGTGGESGPGPGPSFINTYQRGAQESVWETVPQPTTDLFEYGGTNGCLDLFVGDRSERALAGPHDYSHATNTAYADASKVAAYLGGALAWGVEP